MLRKKGKATQHNRKTKQHNTTQHHTTSHLTGCMVPPVTTTARHSWTMGAKWTAGFNSRNFSLAADILAGVGDGDMGSSSGQQVSNVLVLCRDTSPALEITILPSLSAEVRAARNDSMIMRGDLISPSPTFSPATAEPTAGLAE